MKDSTHPMILRLLPLFFLLAGCAGLGTPVDAPRVHLRNLGVADMTLFEQRYRLELRIQNPSEQPLEVKGMSYTLDLNGKEFASGVHGEPFTVPAYGDTLVDVEMSGSLMGVLRQIQQFSNSVPERFSYRLSGSLNIPGRFGRVSFEDKGEVDMPKAGAASRSGGSMELGFETVRVNI